MTTREIADRLGISMTSVRMKCYQLGLKKQEQEYWTPEQVECLRRNYKTLGDTELAEIFNRRWKKKKRWRLKHIEKKRRQLGLKRIKEEVDYIRRRNIEKDRFKECALKRWAKNGSATEGEIHVWSGDGSIPFKVIKIRGRWVPYARWFYRQYIGTIPAGCLVVVKDGDPLNITKENLGLIRREKHGPRNKTQTLEYKRGKAKSILKYKIIQNEKQIKRLEQSSL